MSLLYCCFVTFHIDKGVTLNLLQCLRVVCGCKAIQTKSVGDSHWHYWLCSYCHNKKSSGLPPVFLECTSSRIIPDSLTHLTYIKLIPNNQRKPTCSCSFGGRQQVKSWSTGSQQNQVTYMQKWINRPHKNTAVKGLIIMTGLLVYTC